MSFPTLITNRTREDVTEAVRLTSTPYFKLSDVDKEKLNGSLRGAYNATDFNRVTSAMQYLQTWFKATGYDIPVVLKTWNLAEIPSRNQLKQYLDSIKSLRSAIAVLPTTPTAPETMDGFTYSKANDIEQILVDLDELLTKMATAYRHCGAAVCGIGGLIR